MPSISPCRDMPVLRRLGDALSLSPGSVMHNMCTSRRPRVSSVVHAQVDRTTHNRPEHELLQLSQQKTRTAVQQKPTVAASKSFVDVHKQLVSARDSSRMQLGKCSALSSNYRIRWHQRLFSGFGRMQHSASQSVGRRERNGPLRPIGL